MPFNSNQLKKLASKLPERYVKTRSQRGITLSYVEGWHVIDEANRVFGFDAWDRETLSADCVYQEGRLNPKACTYTARVRVRVRAGETLVYRDGSGVGHGSGASLGEAHESALKEAETDATKRALTTFGNLFGLALYDKEQAGVRRRPKATDPWVLLGGNGEALSRHDRPQKFCSDLRQRINQAASLEDLESIWTSNAKNLSRLRAEWPELRTNHDLHYSEILGQVYEEQKGRLNSTPVGVVTVAEDSGDPRDGHRPAPDLPNSSPKALPEDEQNRPLPINLRADMPRLR
jgi:DNA recombination protein Rad52